MRTNLKTWVLSASLISSSMLMLGGCVEHSNAYLKNAGSTPNLVLPYHHRSNVLDNDYPLPAHPAKGAANPDLLPPGLDLAQYHSHKDHHSTNNF